MHKHTDKNVNTRTLGQKCVNPNTLVKARLCLSLVHLRWLSSGLQCFDAARPSCIPHAHGFQTENQRQKKYAQRTTYAQTLKGWRTWHSLNMVCIRNEIQWNCSTSVIFQFHSFSSHHTTADISSCVGWAGALVATCELEWRITRDQILPSWVLPKPRRPILATYRLPTWSTRINLLRVYHVPCVNAVFGLILLCMIVFFHERMWLRSGRVLKVARNLMI